MSVAPLTDLYVLARERSALVVDRVRREFGKNMEECRNEYFVPQYAKRHSARFRNAQELVEFLLEETHEPYTIYFQSRDCGSPVRNLILSFTADCALIVGVSVACSRELDILRHLNTLANAAGGEYGYQVVESPPPATSAEFMNSVRSAEYPKLIP